MNKNFTFKLMLLTIIVFANLFLIIYLIFFNDNNYYFEDDINFILNNKIEEPIAGLLNNHDNVIDEGSKPSEDEMSETQFDIFNFSNNDKTEEVNKDIISDLLYDVEGIKYYYTVDIVDSYYNYSTEDGFREDNYESEYIIDYDSQYEDISLISVDEPYAEIIYDEYFRPVKQTIYEGESNIVSITIKEYSEDDILIRQKTYNPSFFIIIEKTFSHIDGNLFKENVYDEYGNIIYIRNLNYNNIGQLNRETIVDSNNQLIDIIRYEYSKENYINKQIYLSGDGIIHHEYELNKKGKPITKKYYVDGKKVVFKEVIEYYEDNETVKSITNYGETGGILQESFYDIDGYQIKLINYLTEADDEKEINFFTYFNYGDNKLLDIQEVYIGNSELPSETISYFYDEDGNMSNWIKYDMNGDIISSMDRPYTD